MDNIFSLHRQSSPVPERQLALLDALEDVILDARHTTEITMIEIIGLLRFVEAQLLGGGNGFSN